MILMVAITITISKIQGKLNDDLLKAKDARMKVTEEIVQIIKFIKINAQQKYFFQKLNKKREAEVLLNRKVSMYTVLITSLYELSPVLIVSLTFLTYKLIGNEITASITFTTMVLFKMLQFPMSVFPSSITEMIQIWSSIKRI